MCEFPYHETGTLIPHDGPKESIIPHTSITILFLAHLLHISHCHNIIYLSPLFLLYPRPLSFLPTNSWLQLQPLQLASQWCPVFLISDSEQVRSLPTALMSPHCPGDNSHVAQFRFRWSFSPAPLPLPSSLSLQNGDVVLIDPHLEAIWYHWV